MQFEELQCPHCKKLIDVTKNTPLMTSEKGDEIYRCLDCKELLITNTKYVGRFEIEYDTYKLIIHDQSLSVS